MDKPKALYLVQSLSGRTLLAWAASNNQIKRTFCREYGISPSNYWCGLSALTDRRLKPKEVKSWEEQAEANHDTLIFFRECWRSARKPMRNGSALYERLSRVCYRLDKDNSRKEYAR